MLELKVCIGSSCHLKGGYHVIQTFQELIDNGNLEDRVDMKAQFCMKQCQKGVSVSLGDELFSVSPETAEDFFQTNVASRL